MSLTYINPIELLNLSGLPVTSIEAAIIKKKRKELLADLELGDGTKDYKGQRLDRSACERACDELDEPAHLRAWHRLANIPALNDFLGSGLTDFLLNPASASSLSADTNLLRLIGPRYAVQYDQALLSAFRARSVARVQQVVVAPALYLPSENQQAHQSLSRLLREKLEEVRVQTDSFDADDDAGQVSVNLTRTLNMTGWTALLNALPTGSFGGLRTDLAMAVRNFAIQFHNTFYEQAPALKLLQEAATLQLDGQSADRVREDIRQIQEIEDQRRERVQVEAVAGQFGKAFEQLLTFQKQVDSGSVITDPDPDSSMSFFLESLKSKPPSSLLLSSIAELERETIGIDHIRQWNIKLTALVIELNSRSDLDIATARDSLAIGLRSLSISIWNNNQADGKVAVALLTTGLTLKLSLTTSSKLNSDKNQLDHLIVERDQAVKNRLKQLIFEQEKKVAKPPSFLVVIVIFIIIGILIAVLNSCQSPISNKNYPPTTKDTTVDTATPAEAGISNTPTSTYVPEVSKYSGNQLHNGASPLDNYFGRSRYAGPAWVNFKNNNNDTDAIVCLARTRDNKVIRNEYIRARTTFRMSHIPAGSYYMKVFYGRDWNPMRRSACGTKGYFDTDQRFSESRAEGDLVNIRVSGYSYTTGTMTLYSVAGGNMAHQSIDAIEFFRQ